MDKKPSWWQRRKISILMGRPTAQWRDIGKIDAHTVIRFKDYYVGLMERDGEIVNFGWSKDPHMFPDVNINDFWTSAPNLKGKQEEQ